MKKNVVLKVLVLMIAATVCFGVLVGCSRKKKLTTVSGQTEQLTEDITESYTEESTEARTETKTEQRTEESSEKVMCALNGHTWVEATCTEPKTCEVCGQTEGESLGHKWIEATCTVPKTCSRCQHADGDALGHSYGDDGKCLICSAINPSLYVQSLEITNDSSWIEEGKEIQVEYDTYPSNAIYEKVTYRIYGKNSCGATLSETGVLTCTKPGKVEIMVTVDDGTITARKTFYVPQKIATAEEFYNIRNDLDGVYMLENDIDLSTYENWEPIGYATKDEDGKPTLHMPLPEHCTVKIILFPA